MGDENEWITSMDMLYRTSYSIPADYIRVRTYLCGGKVIVILLMIILAVMYPSVLILYAFLLAITWIRLICESRADKH